MITRRLLILLVVLLVGCTPKPKIVDEDKALERSAQHRWYCGIITSDGKELVRNGLARVYGTKTVLPDGRDSKSYVLRLKAVEEEAKAAKRGGWMQ